MIKKIYIFASFLAFISFFAQKKHTVVKGDNPYNISKKYGISVNELFKMNPEVKDGKLAIGDVLSVSNPAKTASTTVKTKISSSNEIGNIVLQPKQTIYGITKQYHITETDLRKLNPNLDSGMKIGDQIVIPLENIKKYGGNQQAVAIPKETNMTEVPVVANSDFYTVEPKDNYSKILRKFGISQKVLFALNPGLEENGLKAGDYLKIKDSQTNSTTNQASKTAQNGLKSDDYIMYTVQEGDTVFSIINKYGITIEELVGLNPNLSTGLKPGMVLKLKKIDAAYIKKNNNALNIVMMLPFDYDSGSSNYRTMSMDFLTGAKLAIERSATNGQQLNVKVIDAGNETTFKNTLTQINKDNTDLIIGPFFKSSVLEVLDYVGNTKIPVVAPFANSSDLYNYSNLIIVETNDQSYLDGISKEVKEVYSDQKIYIVADEDKVNANYLKSNLGKILKNPNITIVNSPLDIQVDKNMATGQAAPVIAILVNENNDVGENFVNRMIALSKETQGIRTFSSVYVPIFEKKVDELSQVNLVYLMNRTINTEGSFENEILAAYKSKYCKKPSKYAVIGFDVVNDMLSRENKKGEIFKQIDKVQTQLATKFEFVKSKQNGAYINTGYRVVRLVP